MSSQKPEDLGKSLDAFKKCCNVDMCFSIALQLEMDEEDMTRLKTELIDILANQHKFQEAADLLC